MFHPLPHISKDELPKRFTYPFHYKVHPLCHKVGEVLQAHLKEWHWDSESQGKMFGILIVENKNNEVGYLLAYSGNLIKPLKANLFVPPIFDLQAKDNFFIKGEKELNDINHQIKSLSSAPELQSAKDKVADQKQIMDEEISTIKSNNKKAKAHRKQQRLATQQSEIQETQQRLDDLIKESQLEKIALKRITKAWQIKIHAVEEEVLKLENNISALKQERKEKSAALQQRIFDQYQLLNAHGERKNLCTIFQEVRAQIPPAGAGDCAAPRLLQYAYEHDLQPRAMAEFWWGKSPLSVIRKQGNYYPSCRGKCEPILSHMLLGLKVDDNPLLQQKTDLKVEIIYEDDSLIIINKPAGMLSAKGKTEQKCVLDSLREQRPLLTTLYTAHRLDMATSGLMIIAKDEDCYKNLQAQFLNRQIKKRYEAILDGIITEENGKIELPLRVDLDNRPQQMVCYEHGKKTLTQWKKMSVDKNTTRMAFYPITGRTHQLRVHAAHTLGLNTPILGDALYGTESQRLLLHAGSIEFTHPQTQKKMVFKSKVPF